MPGVTVDARELEAFEEELDAMGEKVLDKIEGETGAQIRVLMSTTAKNLAPSNRYRAGGTLREMIDSAEQGFATRDSDGVNVGITSHAHYSSFVEYGTGPKGDPKVPHTSKTHWTYFDEVDQVFRPGVPQKPRHFMEPALDENIDNIMKLLSGAVEEVFDND